MDCYRYSSVKGVRIFTVRVESMDCYRYRSFRQVQGYQWCRSFRDSCAGATGMSFRDLWAEATA